MVHLAPKHSTKASPRGGAHQQRGKTPLLLAKSHPHTHLLPEASVSEADIMSSIHGDTMSTPDRLLANPSTPWIGAGNGLCHSRLSRQIRPWTNSPFLDHSTVIGPRQPSPPSPTNSWPHGRGPCSVQLRSHQQPSLVRANGRRRRRSLGPAPPLPACSMG